MCSAGKQRGKHQKKTSPKPSTSGEIQKFLSNAHGASPATKMADATMPGPHNEWQPQDPTTSLPLSVAPDMDFTTPAVFRPDSQKHAQSPHTPLRADVKLRALLQALPTRSDIEAIVSRLEATHRKEIEVVRQEVQTLSDRMGSGESSVAAL